MSLRLVLVAALLTPLAAGADVDRWVPAVSVLGGASVENWEVEGNSGARGRFEGDTDVLFPFVGLSAELMTPSAASLSRWGSPRLFVHGGVSFTRDSGWNTAKEGSQGNVEIPIIDLNRDGIPDGEPSVDSARGRGSTARHEADMLRLSIGLGVAFELQLLDRTLRVRPSVGYQWQETEFRLAVSDAQSIAGASNCPCRVLQLDERDTQGFHGVGPRLELEVDASRLGPVGLSIYAGMQAFHELGERHNRLRATGQFDDATPASAEATFDKKPWTFNGLVGFRLRWLGEEALIR